MKYLLGFAIFFSALSSHAEGLTACERAALPAAIIAKLKVEPTVENPLGGNPGATVIEDGKTKSALFNNKLVHFVIMDTLKQKNYGRMKTYKSVIDTLSNFSKRFEAAEIERFLSDVVDLLALRLSFASSMANQSAIATMAKSYKMDVEAIYQMNSIVAADKDGDYAVTKVALFYMLAGTEVAAQVAQLQSRGARFLSWFGTRPSRTNLSLYNQKFFDRAVESMQKAAGDSDVLAAATRDLTRLYPSARNRAVRSYLLGTQGMNHDTFDHLVAHADALELDALTRAMLTEKDTQLIAAQQLELQQTQALADARGAVMEAQARKRIAQKDAQNAVAGLSARVDAIRNLAKSLEARRIEVQKFLGQQEAVALKGKGIGMPEAEFVNALDILSDSQIDVDESYDTDDLSNYAGAVEKLLTDNAATLSVQQFLRVADAAIKEAISWDLSDESDVEYAEYVLQKLHAGAARIAFSNDELAQLFVYLQDLEAELALDDDNDQQYADLIRAYQLRVWGVIEHAKPVIADWERELSAIGHNINQVERAIQDALSDKPSASPEEIFVRLKQGLEDFNALRDSNIAGVASTEKARVDTSLSAKAIVGARRQHQKNQADLAAAEQQLEVVNGEISALEEQERALSSGQAVQETPPAPAPVAPAVDPVPQAVATKSTRILGGMESRMTRAHAQAVEDSDLSVWYEAFKTELSERQDTLTESDLFSFVDSSLNLFIDSNDWDYDDLDDSDFEAYKDIVEAVQEAARHVHLAKDRLGVSAQNMEKLRASLARLKDCFPDTGYRDEFAALSELVDDVWEGTDGSVSPAAPAQAPVEKLDLAGVLKAIGEKKAAREALIAKIAQLETAIQGFRP